ncbi:MAG: hypothetical protein ACKPJD_33600, partial [Planctomycetaceae bacterium]
MGLGNGVASMMLSRGRKSKSVVSGQLSVGRAVDGSPRVCVLCGIYGLDGTAVRDAHAVLGVCFVGVWPPSPPSALPRLMRARGGIVVSWRFGSREAA